MMAEADYARENEQHAEIEAVGRQEPIDSQQAADQAQNQHYGEIGNKEKHDTFHDSLHRNRIRADHTAP